MKTEKLQFARLKIEVKLNQDFPDQLTFIDEKGVEKTIDVKYEWKPILCANCKKIGHGIDDCRWKKEKKVWKPKLPNQIPDNDVGVVQKPDDQEFQMVRTASRRAESPIVNTVVRNSFAALEELEVDVIFWKCVR